MGTNYYAIPKVNEEAKKSMVKAIECENFGLLKSMLPDTVHIGKSSFGWPFTFNHNNWNYYKDADDMFKWLERCEIHDEYGRDVLFDEFKQLVESRQDKRHLCQRPDWYEQNGGYVFSTSTDFS